MRRVLLFAAFMMSLCGMGQADVAPQQITTTSWHGLSGLYVIPTARIVGHGRTAISYNESKHVEYIGDARFMDRQNRGTVTYGINDRLEVSASYLTDMLSSGDGFTPALSNENFNTFSFKYQFVTDRHGLPAVSVAVRDVANNMQDVGPFEDVNNGLKLYMLATKRVINKKETGRFVDATLGLTVDKQLTSGLFGVEVALSPMVSYIAEGMWDSPYLNFKGIYSGPGGTGHGDEAGRFIFDMGLRLYPDVVPGAAIDFGIVADSQPEFSWGFSYVFGL
ncbi:MAG: hypothetical protein ABFD54_16050 [Armatimonadota bacterium]|nr:YjbH domain-containing protein [bacterium]